MNTARFDRGFAGLSGWVVDNQEDLALAKQAMRGDAASPIATPSVTSITPASNRAEPPTPTRKASYEPPEGMSGGTVAAIVAIGLVGVLLLLISAVNQPGSSSTEAAARMAKAEAAANVLPDADNGWEVVSNDPALSPVVGYVVAENANVRVGAGTGSAVIGAVPQMTQVLVTGREGSWSRVQVDVDGLQRDGYIAAKLLHEGDSDGARGIVCDVIRSVRPESGEVLVQRNYGPHHLTVNAGARDALVKLRTAGVTALAFYVRAGESGTVQSIPDGTYQIMFATGDGFSRRCLEFVTSMQVISDPSPQTFSVTSDGYAEYYSTGTYTLTRQTGGNFSPQTVDNSTFRE